MPFITTNAPILYKCDAVGCNTYIQVATSNPDRLADAMIRQGWFGVNSIGSSNTQFICKGCGRHKFLFMSGQRKLEPLVCEKGEFKER